MTSAEFMETLRKIGPGGDIDRALTPVEVAVAARISSGIIRVGGEHPPEVTTCALAVVVEAMAGKFEGNKNAAAAIILNKIREIVEAKS